MLIKKMMFLVMAVLLFFTCSEQSVTPDDDPGEEELITTVLLTLTESGGAAADSAVWEDLDGEGGSDPRIGELVVESGKSYTGTVQFLNESVNPFEDITAEVRDEAENHQVFYAVEGAVSGGIALNVTDQDGNGLPLGLDYTVEVTAAAGSSGSLRVILYHFDDAGDKDGTTPSDETDVDILIPVRVN